MERKEGIVSKDTAVVSLIRILSITGADRKAAETIKDRGMDIFRRHTDGSWKILLFITFQMDGN